MARLAKLGLWVAGVWFVISTGFAMVVNPPRGEAVLTADQQAALAVDTAGAEAAAFDFRVAQVEAAEHCAPVSVWKRQHPGTIPARMVEHADGSGVIHVIRWTYPAPVGHWVVGLCGG